jgi:hypothetical protein
MVVSYLRKGLAVALAVAFVVVVAGPVAHADTINGPGRPVTVGSSGETPLQTVFNDTMTNPFQVSPGPGTDQSLVALFVPVAPSSSTTIVIEIAGFSGLNTVGIYSAANNLQTVELFQGSDSAGTTATLVFAGGFVTVDGGTPVAFNLSQGLGFYISTPAGDTFYTEDDRNIGGSPQSLVFQGEGGGQDITVGGNTYALGQFDWVIAFEDQQFATTDRDYNDFVFIAQGLTFTPEPATLALFGLGGLGGMAVRAVRRRRARA